MIISSVRVEKGLLRTTASRIRIIAGCRSGKELTDDFTD